MHTTPNIYFLNENTAVCLVLLLTVSLRGKKNSGMHNTNVKIRNCSPSSSRLVSNYVNINS